MGKDVYSFNWKVLQKVWINSFIIRRVTVAGNNNLIHHTASRKIALIDLMRQEGTIIKVRLSRSLKKYVEIQEEFVLIWRTIKQGQADRIIFGSK